MLANGSSVNMRIFHIITDPVLTSPSNPSPTHSKVPLFGSILSDIHIINGTSVEFSDARQSQILNDTVYSARQHLANG